MQDSVTKENNPVLNEAPAVVEGEVLVRESQQHESMIQT